MEEFQSKTVTEEAQRVSRENEPAPDGGKKAKRKRVRAVLREHFSAPRIAYMALFTALAYVVTFLEFPLFPAVPVANQLKLDFANIFFMITGFVLGPIEAAVSILVKELLCCADSQTGCVGEIANFIMSLAYVLVPSVAYRFKKGRWWVMLYLVAACAVQVGVSFLVNLYINFPLFGNLYGFDGKQAFWAVWQFVIYFNLIKSVLISLVVILVYKPLSRLITYTSEKFERRMAKAKKP